MVQNNMPETKRSGKSNKKKPSKKSIIMKNKKKSKKLSLTQGQNLAKIGRLSNINVNAKKPNSQVAALSEFEGIQSFEEISSYKLFREVSKYGKKSVRVQVCKSKKELEPVTNEIPNEPKKTSQEIEAKKKSKVCKTKKKSKEKKENKVLKKKENKISKKELKTCNVKAWQEIFTPPIVLDAIKEIGFEEPSAIQKLTIPAAIKGQKDIVGAAETGSGKTLAFVIPIIHGILHDREVEASKEEEEESTEEDEEMDDESEDEGVESENEGVEIEDEGVEIEEGDEELESEDEHESEDEELESEDEEHESEDEEHESEDEELESEDEEMEGAEEENENGEEMDAEESSKQGIGCVKVINDVVFDFPVSNSLKRVKFPRNKLRALIITPTRELAVQIKKHTDAVLSKTDIKTALVIGGLCSEKQERLLNAGPDIVIGTPGRLWEFVQQGNPHLSQLPAIRFLAIDETDRMLEKGHFEELKQLLELVNSEKESKKRRQNFVFSATLTLTHEAPKRYNSKKKITQVTSDMKLDGLMSVVGVRARPKIVDITRKVGTAEGLSETKMFCDKDEKDTYLYYFLSSFPGRTLIFCNSINCVKRLSNLLAILQCKPQALHASKQQKQRLKSLERFTRDEMAVLLATDVAARGLDIPGVDHIIHYEVPKTAESYVHRSGRTARASHEGLSVLLISSTEVGKYRQLCSTLNRASDLPSFPIQATEFKRLEKIVQMARDIEKMEFDCSKKQTNEAWLIKMSEEAGLDVGTSDLDDEESAQLAMSRKNTSVRLKSMRKQLDRLLSRPQLKKNFSGRYPTETGKLVLPKVAFQPEAGKAIDLVNKANAQAKIVPQVKKTKKRKRKFFNLQKTQ